MKNSTEFVSNGLAIVTKVLWLLSDLNISIHRRRLLVFRHGLQRRRGELLLSEDKSSSISAAARVVAAKDGSGDYTTVKEAFGGVKKKSLTRQVIYVKKGVYEENIDLEKDTWNVMFVGDGKTKTIISAGLNFVNGTPTFSTATFGFKR